MLRFLRVCFLVITIALFSCNKTIQAPSYPSYYGKWQYIGSSFGPTHTTPSVDSIVILTLKPDNSYTTTLNGNMATQGSFRIDSNSYGVTLEFLNIKQTYGNATIVTTNGPTFLFFNFSQIGQLTLFQYNATTSPGDTLDLTSSPLRRNVPTITLNVYSEAIS